MNESLGRVLVVKARPFDKKIRYLVFRVYYTVEDIAKIQLTFLQQLSHIYIYMYNNKECNILCHFYMN